MYASVIEIDLHGKNAYQAEIAIDAALRRASAAACRIRVVHGYNSGTALMELVREKYARHPKVRRISTGLNRGVTELILREY